MDPNNLPALPANRMPGEYDGFGPGSRVEPYHATFDGQPPILTGQPNAWTLLAAFKRRWRLAVGVGLVVALAAGTIGWFVGTSYTYTAFAMFKVQSEQPKVWMNIQSNGARDFPLYQREQAALARNRLVLTAALRDDKLKIADLPIIKEQDEPLDYIEGKIGADFATSPTQLRISMSGKDGESALAIVKAVAKAYLDENRALESKLRATRKSNLDDVIKGFKETLKADRSTLENMTDLPAASGLDAKGTTVRQDYLLKELDRMQSELLGLDAEIRHLQVDQIMIEQHERDPKGDLQQGWLDDLVKNDKIAKGYVGAIDKIEETLAAYRRDAAHPTAEKGYIEAERLQTQYRKALEGRRVELKPELEKMLADYLAKQKSAREERQKLLQRLAETIKAQMANREKAIRDMTKEDLKTQDIRDRIELLKDMAGSAAKELQALQVEMKAPDRVEPMGEPYLVKHEALGLKVASLAALGAFLLVTLSVSYVEFRYRRVNDVGEVTRGLRLPVVGTIPIVQRGGARKKSKVGIQQVLIESVDMARTLLLHQFRQKNLRVVMITSAGSGEGKTLLSAHLAGSLARAGSRVLLIDGDLRRPSLHKVFGLRPGAGLGDALRGEADLRSLVQSGPIDGLWVMSAGAADVLSLRALVHGVLPKLLEELKQDYDFILIDSAPVLPVADSQLIAQAVDGVILSVLQDVSRLPSVYAAYERLMLFQANLLGVILHGAQSGAQGSNYPYLPLPAPKAVAATEPANPEPKAEE